MRFARAAPTRVDRRGELVRVRFTQPRIRALTTHMLTRSVRAGASECLERIAAISDAPGLLDWPAGGTRRLRYQAVGTTIKHD